MKYPEILIPENKALDLVHFREMDYFAVNNYKLPIEMMMENAGLLLANFVAAFAEMGQRIKIGVGNGNNGGGGLVAARRLAAWGFTVYLDLFAEITKELPVRQFERAIKFGAKVENIPDPDVWVDAYLGFSQRLPLPESLIKIIEETNHSRAVKISLDIPTGFTGDLHSQYFEADKILTLAAPKKILYKLDSQIEIFIADLGIPKEVYAKFETEQPPFYKNNILKLNR
jgi:NAD(P)H-hydrate epimerase